MEAGGSYLQTTDPRAEVEKVVMGGPKKNRKRKRWSRPRGHEGKGEIGGKGVARTMRSDDEGKSGSKWIRRKEKQKRRRKAHEG